MLGQEPLEALVCDKTELVAGACLPEHPFPDPFPDGLRGGVAHGGDLGDFDP